jgi:hypothetical protein
MVAINKQTQTAKINGYKIKVVYSYRVCMHCKQQVNKEKRDEGGLHHSTYKAVVQRDGAFKSTDSKIGSIDFNEDLSAPMSKHFSFAWNQIFK